jgi:hypothetical protein
LPISESPKAGWEALERTAIAMASDPASSNGLRRAIFSAARISPSPAAADASAIGEKCGPSRGSAMSVPAEAGREGKAPDNRRRRRSCGRERQRQLPDVAMALKQRRSTGVLAARHRDRSILGAAH